MSCQFKYFETFKQHVGCEVCVTDHVDSTWAGLSVAIVVRFQQKQGFTWHFSMRLMLTENCLPVEDFSDYIC